MKSLRMIIATLAFACVVSMSAQSLTFNIVDGQVTYRITKTKTGDMVFNEAGDQLTVCGKAIAMTEAVTMFLTDDEVDETSVYIDYSSEGATAIVPGDLMRYVDVVISNGDVTVTQSSEAGADTSGEINYVLAGTSTDGSFTLNGSYKCTVILDNLNLTSTTGAPLNIQNGKRIKLALPEGTTNTLVDCADGSQKGAIVCKGHLEFRQKGSLTVTGNTAHAIYAKEYVDIKNCNITVTSSVKDGLNCNQYFLMQSGSLNIVAAGDDGVQVSYKDDTDRDEEDTGCATIEGGTITINISATASKGIKADADVYVTGGTVNITSTAGGEWDSDKVKTKASACIGADGNVEISGGELTLKATGGGGKGISCDGEMNMTGGTLNVSTSGGILAYVNSTLYQNYTGNTDNLDSDYKSSPKGVKADSGITIDGGNINVTTTGKGGEGIESKAELTINGGTIYITSYDDAINSSSHMNINGGDITVIASNNDGLDSNGNLYVNGGTIRAFGATSPECGIDANEEEGYTVYFTGGSLLAAGGGNSVPSNSNSTQAYVIGSGSLTAGTTVTVKSGSEVLATFTVPDEYKGSSSGNNRPGGGFGGSSSSGTSPLITCPGLVSGQSYTVTIGSTSTSATAKQYGSSSRP